jgi:uncharacterized protein YaeQ
MALTATLYHLQIDLSDVDRGVYRTLDLRVARHPSESMRFMLTRVIAFCLFHEEGLAFSKGLSTADEPAIWRHDGMGRIDLWIDVGAPAPERLHKASKAARRVVVFTYGDPELLRRQARGKTIHEAERIEIRALPAAFLDAVEEVTERHTRWELLHTNDQLYVTARGKTLEAPVTRSTLA